MPVQYFPVSWSQYHNFAQSLAEKILADNKKFDEIVAISRGGLTLGHLLSDLLRIPISTITIQSYTDIQTQGELKIIHPLQSDIKNKQVLLVDDVSDSGKTLRRAISYLKDFHPKNVTTVTLFYKPHSIFRPDYFAKSTTRWILFPYEPTEMILLIKKSLEKEGKSKEEIEKFLVSLSFTPDQILFAQTYYPS